MNFEFNPFRLLIPSGGEPITDITVASNLDWYAVPDVIHGPNAGLPINARTDIAALKVFGTGAAVGLPSMITLQAEHIPQLPISKIDGLQTSLNSLVKSIASGNATALSVTNNGIGDYLITPLFGTVVNKIAQGNDSRFPSNVAGLRKGSGLASLDIAAVAKTDYWDTTEFSASGASHAKGLVPDPGVTPGTTKFLCEDKLWKTPAGVGTVTSITVTVPSDLAVAPATITSAGTFAVSRNTQTQNKFLASPIGATGVPVYRIIDFADVSALTGNTATKLAIGNDARFPASVTGIRKSSGAGSTDVAAVAKADYWDTTVFNGVGPSASVGLVPNPGTGILGDRYLREDGQWRTVPAAVASVSPARTLKGNPTGFIATPTDVTAKDSRSSQLLNIESITAFGNADYTALATDRYIATSVPLTADRNIVLPLANSFNAGQSLTIADDAGSVGTYGLFIWRQGADLIQNSSASMAIRNTYGSVLLISDGVSKWGVARRSPAVVKSFFTTSGTYTRKTGIKAMFIECVGGGGGGGAAKATASNTALGTGGGGGAYSATYITNPAASYSYTVGGGGAGGPVSAAGDGGGGGTTSFGGVCVAVGGLGGAGDLTGGSSPLFSYGATGGGAASGTGDVKIPGGDGGNSCRQTGFWGAAGAGGNSILGGVSRPPCGTGNAAANGGNIYGGGGSGAMSGSLTGFVGGVGAQGIIIITEYY